MIDGLDFAPVALSLALAGTTTLVLLLVATPIAWRLAFSRSALKPAAEAVVALPLVLPPTVLGFYLLTLMAPSGAVGSLWTTLTGDSLVFSFEGLVIASTLYSLPFAVQPLQLAFEQMGRAPLEAASSLGARPLDAFFSVGAPLALRGFVTAAVLSFAHTIGEFGVVLMIGGAIPGETRVVSIAIWEEVETLDWAAAHIYSAGLLVFSMLVLVIVYALNRRLTPHGR